MEGRDGNMLEEKLKTKSTSNFIQSILYRIYSIGCDCFLELCRHEVGEYNYWVICFIYLPIFPGDYNLLFYQS